MLTSVLVFLLYPARKGAPTDLPSIVDLVLVALTVVSIGYWIDQYVSYAMFRVSSPNQTDLIMGGIAILIMLETSRRALGPIISLIAVVFILQLYYGSYLPGRLSHPGMSVERILERSEEHTSELQSLMRISYAVVGLKQKKILDHPRHLRRTHTMYSENIPHKTKTHINTQ